MSLFTLNKTEDLLSIIKPLALEYAEIEMTNFDQTGVKQRRAVYFYEKRLPRRGNVFLEVWYNVRPQKLEFVFSKLLLTPSEIAETNLNRRPTANRGILVRENMSEDELISFVRNKLDLYYAQNNLRITYTKGKVARKTKENSSMTDYVSFWTGFQNYIKSDGRIQALFDDSINEKGVGKNKNSYVCNINAQSYAVPYWIEAHLNNQKGFISVDMYFRKKRKYATEVLEFFINNKNELQRRLEHELYMNDPNKTEVRMSYRKPIFEFDPDEVGAYYSWLAETMIKMNEAFEGLRNEKKFYPDLASNQGSVKKTSEKDSLFMAQINESGLGIADNWKGDPRDRFVKLLRPLVNDSEYYFEYNMTDSSGKFLELYKRGLRKRLLLFKGKQDMTLGVAFNRDFYDAIAQKVKIPENKRPNKTQPHVDLTLAELWNIICAATGKEQYMSGETQPVSKPLPEYTFVRKLHSDKNVILEKRTQDGALFVEKRYEHYNKIVFERLRELNIEGIPRFYVCEEQDGVLRTLEDYIPGRDLNDVYEKEGFFDEQTVIDIAIKVCNILERIHGLNPPLIHRDIKPSNIIISDSGEVHLIDFNATKEYHAGNSRDTILLGTQFFAAPEQILGYGASDVRADIYGLGATMNYLLTGMHVNEFLATGPLGNVIGKCTKMDKNDRYSSVTELKRVLKKVKVA